MPLAVDEVLAFDILRAARPVAGLRHLARREVRSVAVIEVPVDEFVRAGDLVLTTAMDVGHDPVLFAAFVRDVARSGAAALLVALGPYARAIPAEVAAVADDLGLPLVELPWALRFSEISQVVLGRLLDEQHAVVRESLALQQRLTRLVVDGADLAGLARALAAMLDRPVVVTDATGRALARGGAAAGLEVRAQEAVRRAIAPPSGEDRAGPDALRVRPELGLLLAAVEVVRETCGYIAVPLGGAEPTVAERLTLQHAATAAALCFLQRRAAEDAARRLRDDFVWSLAAGHLASRDDALARGRLLGYDLERPYAGLYGKIEGGLVGSGDPVPPAPRRILDAIEAVAAQDRRAALATVVGNAVVAFVEVRRPGESLDGVVGRLVERLSGRPPAVAASWGIGAVHDGFDNFRRTHREARAACAIGIRVRGVGSVTHVAQTGAYRMLLGIGGEPESRRFWEGYLRALLDYDRRKGMDLLGTLEAYFETQGNVSETARRLCLHRQSLLYRLQRIEELTGGKLAEPQHRFALELSLHLYRLRDVAPPDADWSHPRPAPAKPARVKSRHRKP